MTPEAGTAAPGEDPEHLLRVRAASVVLGGREVLNRVDVRVPSGKVVGVLGPSGAGKTTLFRAIAGELPLRNGSVLLRGRDVTRAALWQRARAGLGYVPQTPSVLFDLTVADNIRTFEKAASLAAQPLAERAGVVELEHRLGVRARDLSGGERRRLELLRALLPDPQVLVCDEPFAAGDPVHVRLLSRLLREHADRGRAVLLADHRIADALAICDFALLLSDGEVKTHGLARDFADDPAVRDRYLG
jgi:lipopolysaccharide export system ATP-binding protein